MPTQLWFALGWAGLSLAGLLLLLRAFLGSDWRGLLPHHSNELSQQATHFWTTAPKSAHRMVNLLMIVTIAAMLLAVATLVQFLMH